MPVAGLSSASDLKSSGRSSGMSRSPISTLPQAISSVTWQISPGSFVSRGAGRQEVHDLREHANHPLNINGRHLPWSALRGGGVDLFELLPFGPKTLPSLLVPRLSAPNGIQVSHQMAKARNPAVVGADPARDLLTNSRVHRPISAFTLPSGFKVTLTQFTGSQPAMVPVTWLASHCAASDRDEPPMHRVPIPPDGGSPETMRRSHPSHLRHRDLRT